MLSHADNAVLTRTGPGTPMGETMRRYWMPALLSSEIAEPDCAPVRVRLLGEDLIAFRDTQGRIGLLDQFCPHRLASLFLARNEECGLRCVYHGWKFDVSGRCLDICSIGVQDQFGLIFFCGSELYEQVGPHSPAHLSIRRLNQKSGLPF